MATGIEEPYISTEEGHCFEYWNFTCLNWFPILPNARVLEEVVESTVLLGGILHRVYCQRAYAMDELRLLAQNHGNNHSIYYHVSRNLHQK